jgi:hypothetical protein
MDSARVGGERLRHSHVTTIFGFSLLVARITVGFAEAVPAAEAV